MLVDTSVWSLALRRGTPANSTDIELLQESIKTGRVEIIGPIRQELLSGVKDKSQYDSLRSALEPFEDLDLESKDYELAARMFNRCRSKGIQGSNTDFLICSVAYRRATKIFTVDKDFLRFQDALGIPLLPYDSRATLQGRVPDEVPEDMDYLRG